MHLLIPYAGPSSEAGVEALRSLALPNLRALLNASRETERDEGDALSLSPPHERARARALGLQGASGQLPWAALSARQAGLDVGDVAWGLVTPCHWHLGTEQISLIDPAQLQLDDAGSRALFEPLQALFASAGWVLHFSGPTTWYAAHESLANLPTASLDRVVGRNVDLWLGTGVAVRALRRLQAEAQMLLYTHPANAEREARGLLPVNSFWLSACGPVQTPQGAEPTVEGRLRAPALAGDWAAWCKAWDSLDAGPLATAWAGAQAGQLVQITLCGERHSSTWTTGGLGWTTRLQRRLRPLQPAAVLAHL